MDDPAAPRNRQLSCRRRWTAAESLPRRQRPEDYSLSAVVLLAIWMACWCHRPMGYSSPVFLLRLRW